MWRAIPPASICLMTYGRLTLSSSAAWTVVSSACSGMIDTPLPTRRFSTIDARSVWLGSGSSIASPSAADQLGKGGAGHVEARTAASSTSGPTESGRTSSTLFTRRMSIGVTFAVQLSQEGEHLLLGVETDALVGDRHVIGRGRWQVARHRSELVGSQACGQGHAPSVRVPGVAWHQTWIAGL